MRKRGRKQIGSRVCFACPDELFDYVEKFGKQMGCEAWAEALRYLIHDHKRKNGSGKTAKIESGQFIN